jgi:hypothetical protein
MSLTNLSSISLVSLGIFSKFLINVINQISVVLRRTHNKVFSRRDGAAEEDKCPFATEKGVRKGRPLGYKGAKEAVC